MSFLYHHHSSKPKKSNVFLYYGLSGKHHCQKLVVSFFCSDTNNLLNCKTKKLCTLKASHCSMYAVRVTADSPVNVSLIPLCRSEARKNKRVMKVPKGTSDYQATWIVDEDVAENGEADEESSEEDDDDDDMLDEALEGEDEDNMSQVDISSTLRVPVSLKVVAEDYDDLKKRPYSKVTQVVLNFCFFGQPALGRSAVYVTRSGCISEQRAPSLFSHCLSLACSARLLATTIVFGAAVPREASCLPVL